MSIRGKVDAGELRQLYADRRNILAHLRDSRGLDRNDEMAVMVAYDLQAGSYVDLVSQPGPVADRHRESARKLAAVFDDLKVGSLLDAGTGEATLLCSILQAMKAQPSRVHGFDISLSRLLVGRKWAHQHRHDSIGLFAASLAEVPVLTDAFDTVFTNHALEPNLGREREIIQELYRVCRRYLVLREPSYELGGERTRARIEAHRYVRNVPGVLADLGYDVIEHRLFEADTNADNQSALTIVRKRKGEAAPDADPAVPYASPLGKGPLTFTGEAYYSPEDALVFPVISGVPCLLADYGIFASRYLELSEKAAEGA